jgi:hypothetical protein
MASFLLPLFLNIGDNSPIFRTFVSGDAVHQSTWLLLLKIEQTCMVKLQVFG